MCAKLCESSRFACKIAGQSAKRSHHKGRAARGIRKMLACIFAEKLVFTRARAYSGENNFYANDPWIRTAVPFLIDSEWLSKANDELGKNGLLCKVHSFFTSDGKSAQPHLVIQFSKK